MYVEQKFLLFIAMGGALHVSWTGSHVVDRRTVKEGVVTRLSEGTTASPQVIT